MAYNRIQAGRLLAASELAVFNASLGETLTALTASKLRTLVKRARSMRDKAQDLLQRQRVATRGRTGSKDGTTGAANERTEQKLRVLGEALARLEHRLVKLDAAAERAASATLHASERMAKLKHCTQTPARRTAVGGLGKAAPATALKVGAKTAARPAASAPTAARRVTAKPATQVSLKSAVKQAAVATEAAQDQLAGRAPVRSAKAPATAPTGGGTGLPSVSPGADAKGMKQQRKFTGSQAIQAQVGARGRHMQVKRDKR
jgi:hypothetical protein